MESSGAVRISAVGSCAIAAIKIPREKGVYVRGLIRCGQNETHPNPEVTLKEWGGIKLMSVEEPEPGLVGFTRVVSTSVQPSPFKPQPPD